MGYFRNVSRDLEPSSPSMTEENLFSKNRQRGAAGGRCAFAWEKSTIRKSHSLLFLTEHVAQFRHFPPVLNEHGSIDSTLGDICGMSLGFGIRLLCYRGHSSRANDGECVRSRVRGKSPFREEMFLCSSNLSQVTLGEYFTRQNGLDR